MTAPNLSAASPRPWKVVRSIRRPAQLFVRPEDESQPEVARILTNGTTGEGDAFLIAAAVNEWTPGRSLALRLLADRLSPSESYFDGKADMLDTPHGDPQRYTEEAELLTDVQFVRSELLRIAGKMEAKP